MLHHLLSSVIFEAHVPENDRYWLYFAAPGGKTLRGFPTGEVFRQTETARKCNRLSGGLFCRFRTNISSWTVKISMIFSGGNLYRECHNFSSQEVEQQHIHNLPPYKLDFNALGLNCSLNVMKWYLCSGVRVILCLYGWWWGSCKIQMAQECLNAFKIQHKNRLNCYRKRAFQKVVKIGWSACSGAVFIQ